MEEKNNSKKGILYFCLGVLLTLVVCLLVYMFVLDKDESKTNDNNTSNSTTTPTVVSLSTSDSTVTQLYDRFMIDDHRYIYEDLSLDNNLKLGLTLKSTNYRLCTDVEKQENNIGFACRVYLYSDLSKKWKELFGNSSNLALKNDYFAYKDIDGTLIRKNDDVIFDVHSGWLSSECMNTYDKSIVYYAEKLSDNSEMSLYIVTPYASGIGIDTCNIYSDWENKNLVISNVKSKNQILDNKDKLNKYKYTFKLEDGNYYLANIEKVK